MEKRPYSSTQDDSYSNDKRYSNSRNENGGYSNSRNDNGGYSNSRNDSGGYSNSRNDSGGYSNSRNDNGGYSNSRNDNGGYSNSRNDNGYSSRNDNSSYSSRNSNSRDDGYKSRGGGYSSRGRDSGRSPSRYGSQDNSDSWQCSTCRFSNYANRNSCYKCKNPQEGGGGDESNRKWGKSADSSRNLPEIIKNLYVEHPDVVAMTPEEAKRFREDSNELEVYSPKPDEIPVPNPVRTFAQAFSNYPGIMEEIRKKGFDIPSPIQCQSWPILMKGHDMIGTSQTGTGKTLAFLLPGLLHIVAQTTPRWERIGPTCLVLAPTRELAQQIEREVTKFEYENIRCVCCYGQGDKRSQINKLNAMSEIVIATPGRLNDFLEQGVVNLSGVSYLVLDEADRMLNMGFEPQVRKIVMNIRSDRQTILTSATWPTEVRTLAAKLMNDPIHVIVGSLDLKANDTITQNVIVCNVMEKEEKLKYFIQQMKPDDKAIVFVAQKNTVDDISGKLYDAGFNVESMHGGRNQWDREHSLRQLKSGKSKILIATDVAARGIDIDDITYVLNYDCPKDMEEYVHRVGRTGRAGRSGISVTLMSRYDWKVAGKLIEILEKSNQKVPAELEQMARRWDRVKDQKNSFGSRNGGNYRGGNKGGW